MVDVHVRQFIDPSLIDLLVFPVNVASFVCAIAPTSIENSVAIQRGMNGFQDTEH